jgi:hypothetical protein
VPDGFDWWNAVVGTAGILIAVIAIIIAIRSDRRADKVLTEERRRVFELEILRELAQTVDGGLARDLLWSPGKLEEYRLRLKMLSTRLGYWDEVLGFTTASQVLADVDAAELPSLLDQQNDHERERQDLALLLEELERRSNTPSYAYNEAVRWFPVGPLKAHMSEDERRRILRIATSTEAAGKAGRQEVLDALRKRIAEIDESRPAEVAKFQQTQADAVAEVHRRLTQDVIDAIEERMKNQRLQRPKGWFFLPWWWLKV